MKEEEYKTRCRGNESGELYCVVISQCLPGRDGPPSLFSSFHLLASPFIGFGFKRDVWELL
ncbi:hypothetical protein CFP56_018916 [Quercus suber]|uniref:Uncharacterized protein n=1 Tax=Quercus suber TaxID=58331 RepID=A0AAW0KJT4_QUESU